MKELAGASQRLTRKNTQLSPTAPNSPCAFGYLPFSSRLATTRHLIDLPPRFTPLLPTKSRLSLSCLVKHPRTTTALSQMKGDPE